MLTNRSSVLLLIGGIATFAGILRPHEGLALCGITILIWLGFQWFTVQLATRSNRLLIGNLQRKIDGIQDDRYTLAVDNEYIVELTGTINRGRAGFRLSVRDILPEACQIVEGHSQLIIDKQGGSDQFRLVYKVRPQACGRMEFCGVAFSFEDPNGMFQAQEYVALRQNVTVLPYMIRAQNTASVLKINNVQRVLGHHRYKSAGISSELLEIRDYQPGDPPRTIAWKPTARLGKLMSCEFESEVPVRATLIADLSCYQFVGRPGAAVADRTITTVASLARLLLSDRDPVAVVTVNEKGAMRMPHGQGERQLSRMMHALLTAADPNPRIEYLSDSRLVRIVFRECYRRFPKLLESRTSFLPQGRSLLKPVRGKLHKIKTRLAPVLCEVLNYPMGFEFRLIHDPDAMRLACEDWARRYPITMSRVSTPDSPNDQPLRTAANETICQRLMEACSRASDNELFVVVATLPMTWNDFGRLVQVARVCRAAGHRLVFVNAGLPDRTLFVQDPVARELLKAAGIQNNVNFDASDELRSLGVRVANINDPKLIEQVAIEVDIIRSGKVRGARTMTRAGGF